MAGTPPSNRDKFKAELEKFNGDLTFAANLAEALLRARGFESSFMQITLYQYSKGFLRRPSGENYQAIRAILIEPRAVGDYDEQEFYRKRVALIIAEIFHKNQGTRFIKLLKNNLLEHLKLNKLSQITPSEPDTSLTERFRNCRPTPPATVAPPRPTLSNPIAPTVAPPRPTLSNPIAPIDLHGITRDPSLLPAGLSYSDFVERYLRENNSVPGSRNRFNADQLAALKRMPGTLAENYFFSSRHGYAAFEDPVDKTRWDATYSRIRNGRLCSYASNTDLLNCNLTEVIIADTLTARNPLKVLSGYMSRYLPGSDRSFGDPSGYDGFTSIKMNSMLTLKAFYHDLFQRAFMEEHPYYNPEQSAATKQFIALLFQLDIPYIPALRDLTIAEDFTQYCSEKIDSLFVNTASADRRSYDPYRIERAARSLIEDPEDFIAAHRMPTQAAAPAVAAAAEGSSQALAESTAPPLPVAGAGQAPAVASPPEATAPTQAAVFSKMPIAPNLSRASSVSTQPSPYIADELSEDSFPGVGAAQGTSGALPLPVALSRASSVSTQPSPYDEWLSDDSEDESLKTIYLDFQTVIVDTAATLESSDPIRKASQKYLGAFLRTLKASSDDRAAVEYLRTDFLDTDALEVPEAYQAIDARLRSALGLPAREFRAEAEVATAPVTTGAQTTESVSSLFYRLYDPSLNPSTAVPVGAVPMQPTATQL